MGQTIRAIRSSPPLPAGFNDIILIGGVVDFTGNNLRIDREHAGCYIRFKHGSGTCNVFLPALLPGDPLVGAEATFRNCSTGGGSLVRIRTDAPGVIINAPAGGSLNLGPNMVATVKVVSMLEYDVYGQTLAAIAEDTRAQPYREGPPPARTQEPRR